MAGANPDTRLEVIDLIKPVAAWAPDRALRLVRLALAQPAETITIEAIGYVADDARVRDALPRLLFTAAMGAGPQPEILRLLWELGRDQEGPLHSNPDHGIRMINDLCSYSYPLPFARAVLPLVRELVGQKEEMDDHLWSPLDLLPPLLAREGHTASFRGLGFHIDPYFVSEANTREVREEAQAILNEQALGATSRRNRVRAVQVLSEALRLPHSIAGHEPGPKVKEQWHDDQAAIVSALSTIANDSDDAFVVAAVLRVFDWHNQSARWPDLVKQMNAVLAQEREREVRLVGVLGDPFDFRDEEAARHRVDVMAKELVAEDLDGTELAELLEATLESFAELPDHGDRTHAQPARLVEAIIRENAVLGRSIADWCVEHPEARLASGTASILLSCGHRGFTQRPHIRHLDRRRLRPQDQRRRWVRGSTGRPPFRWQHRQAVGGLRRRRQDHEQPDGADGGHHRIARIARARARVHPHRLHLRDGELRGTGLSAGKATAGGRRTGSR